MDSQQKESLQKLTRLLKQEHEKRQELQRRHARLEMENLYLKQFVERVQKRYLQAKAAKG